MKIQKLDIYVPSRWLADGDYEPFGFYKNVKEAFERICFEVTFFPSTEETRAESLKEDSYALFHRNEPWHKNALEARYSGIGEFWAIDKTSDPSEKKVTKALFTPQGMSRKWADQFFEKMIDNFRPPITGNPRPSGHVVILLQGILLRQRFWQSMSPINMIKATIENETKRKIYLKLHPGEAYSQVELDAVNELLSDQVSFSDHSLGDILAECAYTVSINSTASLKALLFKKPGVLFGAADFHHVFQNVKVKEDVESAFKNVTKKNVPFEKYIVWYLQKQMIPSNFKRAQQNILQRCVDLGWDLGDISAPQID